MGEGVRRGNFQRLKPARTCSGYVVAEATTHKAKRAGLGGVATSNCDSRSHLTCVYSRRPAKGSAVASSGISMWIWVPWPSWLRMSILN